ncbi:MAG TPA: hypothetical protein ENN91_02785, partial [Firmicutes bacterium]|nr:hypothetical protein [Bacillota bacterium]
MEKKTHTFKDGAIYEGEWQKGRRHGQGVWTRPDGYRYTGEWADDKPNGLGMLVLPGGRKYIGEWKNGKRHGLGIEIRADGTKITGKWEQGRMVAETPPPAENELAKEAEGNTKLAPAEPVHEIPADPGKEEITTTPAEEPAEEEQKPEETEQQPADKKTLEEDSMNPYLFPD